MGGPDGKLKDRKAVMPDRCYAGVYQEGSDFWKQHGAFDPAKMASVLNVGRMGRKAQGKGRQKKFKKFPGGAP
jgi:isocitrate dehydrogenase